MVVLCWSSKDRFPETKLVRVCVCRLSSEATSSSPPLYINLYPSPGTTPSPPFLVRQRHLQLHARPWRIARVLQWRHDGEEKRCLWSIRAGTNKETASLTKRLMERTERWVMAYMWQEIVSYLEFWTLRSQQVAVSFWVWCVCFGAPVAARCIIHKKKQKNINVGLLYSVCWARRANQFWHSQLI